jgi:hypothetical protein
MFLFPNTLILLKGAGDLGTGVAWRLHKAGFPVVITELAQPLVVRRTVAFASAVYAGGIGLCQAFNHFFHNCSELDARQVNFINSLPAAFRFFAAMQMMGMR